MADKIDILVPKESIDSILAADKAITQLDVVYRRMIEGITTGTKTMKENVATQERLVTIEKEVKKTAEELDAASKKLAASEKALADFDKEKYAATLRNNQALKDQQRGVLEMVQAEKKLTGTIEKAEASTKALTAERKKLDLETVEGTKRLKEINEQIDKNTKVIRENSDAATKQRMNIGNYRSALEGLPGPLGNATTAATELGEALKALLLNPLALAIAAVAGALVGLFKAFKSTEEGGDRLQVIMGKLKGVLDVLKQAAQSVSLALADLFSGKFGQAADHLREGFGGMGQRMAMAAAAGGELAKALDQIADEKLAYNVDAVREKIAQLRTEAAETTNEKEKARLLREAIALTEEVYSKEIDWSKRAADAEIGNVTAKFKVSKDQLTAFLLADEAGRQEQIAGNSSLAQLANSLNNEGLATLRDKLTEESRLRKDAAMETLRMRKTITSAEETAGRESAAAYKQRVDAQRKAMQENAKLEADAIKEMAEEDAKARTDAAAAAIATIDAGRDTELARLNDWYARGAMDFEDYEAEKLRITQKYEELILQEQLKTLQEAAKNSLLTTSQKAEYEARAAAISLKLSDLVAQRRTDNDKQNTESEKENIKSVEEAKKEQLEKDKEAAELRKEIQQAAFDLTSELGNAIFEINNSHIEKEIADIERKRDKAIQAAGEDKDAQAKINAKYDKLVAAEKLKQAKNDRNAALFNIAINTAVAISKAAPNPLLIALAAAVGIIQAGVVLSKPLPTFAKGTKGKYDTPAQFIAGEAGPEWIEKKTGEMMQVNRPTVFKNARGMRVYSNPEVNRINRMMAGGGSFAPDFDMSAVIQSQERGFAMVAGALARQRQYIHENGRAVGYKQNGYKRKYLERMVG
jgi:hypothetical protein